MKQLTPRSMLACVAAGSLLAACAPVTPAVRDDDHERGGSPLARFMRETVNIPYAIALLASHRPGRERRVHRAALVLHEAVQELLAWTDPPVRGEAAREVFYAYAHDLEHHVMRLEHAARAQDTELAAHSLQGIRETCNDCHRFFRPASKLSADVALDLHALDLGGTQ